MKRIAKLSLKREALTDLTPRDLLAVVGAAASDSCATGTDLVCATVGECISDNCVTVITDIEVAITGSRCRV